MPQGLTFTSGNPAVIEGNAAPGTGGQYNLTVIDNDGSFGTPSQVLTLNIYEAPQITSANAATFFTGVPGSFAVTTTGYPSVSQFPVTPGSVLPSFSPSSGYGMNFTVTGLPSDLTYSNIDSAGLATGTLTIQGTPSAADAGVHQVTITADNGVASSQQTITLNIIQITGAVPASGKSCNGNYNGTFKGNIIVSAGQNCSFYGGGVNGNLFEKAGHLSLTNANVTGSVLIVGGSRILVQSRNADQGRFGRSSDDSAGSKGGQCAKF